MWAIVGGIACILGALLPLVARPDVLRVPSEWETLSAAFRQLENNDTILASSGIYEESVVVPPLNFVLWLSTLQQLSLLCLTQRICRVRIAYVF